MTDQEAINKLKYRIETASHIVGTGSENSFEDIEMAIAALEKQVTKRELTMCNFCSGFDVIEPELKTINMYECTDINGVKSYRLDIERPDGFIPALSLNLGGTNH
jgi:hypothetical protein